MNILITTGIYPPKIGGPAQYAKNLKEALERQGHRVAVKTFTIEDRIPTGVRHLWFFLKIIPPLIASEVVFTLDTYSVAVPTVCAAKLFGKEIIIRTGGDFLWEHYVERTKKKVLFRNFYDTETNSFSFKEKCIFHITRWVLRHTKKIIFSTQWQRDIFVKAYHIESRKTYIVENFYGLKESDSTPGSKEFIASTRKLVWKNVDVLEKIFSNIHEEYTDISLYTETIPFPSLMERMKTAYATILVSFGDISPNMILDSIRYNRPFICTREVGIYDRIKDAGMFVDPLNEKEVADAIRMMCTEEGYRVAKQKVMNFNFVHSWDEIATEFLNIYNTH